MSDQPTESQREIGRNEPCPCGSGKKYKRCHGVGAAPKVTPPKNAAPGAESGAPGGLPGGFDPSKMDSQLMMQFAQMMRKLPKGQLQRLQGIMQRAMAGKDVTREAGEFEKTLPLELQQLMTQMGPALASMGAGMGGAPAGEAGLPAPAASAEGGMTEEEARAIVAKAAAEGKISDDQAQELLKDEKKKGGFWKRLTGKNE